MLLSKRWLTDFVEIDEAVDDRTFCEAMTMSGSKVESLSHEGAEISGVVVGKILSVEPHPNADKLVICLVDAGAQAPVTIVTGASNVFAGALVPVALNGSTLPGGVKIKTGKLRGVESQGMLCSFAELGVTKGDFPEAPEDGIFILTEPCRPGQNILKALGIDDTVIDFEITSNRPDCLSVIGLAREASATFKKPLRLHTPVVKGGAGPTQDLVRVTVREPELCPRYCARAVRDVKIAPSPRWLRERLRASGVRPINNIVDITNFVMLEYGQPMHSFDHRFLSGGSIVVRRAAADESIMTLDGTERKLSPEMLVIADEEKPVAVAGVMGGEHSGILPDTTTIVFESAMFDPVSVRLTSKKLGLRSESSSRFEKGLDAQNTLLALSRACELVELLGAGKVCDGVIDIDHSDKTPFILELDVQWVNAFLGTQISEEAMVQALRGLGFTVQGLLVTVPSHRADVRHKADLAEEVARIFGYDNIPTTLITAPTARGRFNAEQKFANGVVSTLLALGFNEICTYSFLSPKAYYKIRMAEDDPLRNSVRILNPLGEDTSIMRTTPLPSMLDALARNFSSRNLSASLFELATVYLPRGENELPEEKQIVTLGMYGEKADFFALKGAVEELLAACGIEGAEFAAQPGAAAFHAGRCADITICESPLHESPLGILGEIHPEVQANYGVDTRVFVAMLDFPTLFAHAGGLRQYRPLPKYPSTARDLAVVCDDAMPAAEIERAIRGACGKTLESIRLFDVYRGNQIPEGKKSAAFTVTMRAADRTLTDSEADRAVEKILKALAAIGAELRS
ncbi:MAG: phenylalanine--tRNA ligase subunit beta [Clostridia bacterium]|nr:phenylalanine--tRNA ligase subunit beta [Clostridia bacterium]